MREPALLTVVEAIEYALETRGRLFQLQVINAEESKAIARGAFELRRALERVAAYGREELGLAPRRAVDVLLKHGESPERQIFSYEAIALVTGAEAEREAACEALKRLAVDAGAPWLAFAVATAMLCKHVPAEFAPMAAVAYAATRARAPENAEMVTDIVRAAIRSCHASLAVNVELGGPCEAARCALSGYLHACHAYIALRRGAVEWRTAGEAFEQVSGRGLLRWCAEARFQGHEGTTIASGRWWWPADAECPAAIEQMRQGGES